MVVGLPGNGYVLLDVDCMSLISMLQHVWLTKRWFLDSLLSLTITTERFGKTSHLGIHPGNLYNMESNKNKITQLKRKTMLQTSNFEFKWLIFQSVQHKRLEISDICIYIIFQEFIDPFRSRSHAILRSFSWFVRHGMLLFVCIGSTFFKSQTSNWAMISWPWLLGYIADFTPQL